MTYSWEHGDTCESCGCKYPDLQKDHKVPKFEGGDKEDSKNIWYICPNCHHLKSQEERQRYWSDENRKVQRERKVGSSVSSKYTDKRSKASSGENNNFYGHTHTEESKQKIEDSKLVTALSVVSKAEERALAKRVFELEKKARELGLDIPQSTD